MLIIILLSLIALLVLIFFICTTRKPQKFKEEKRKEPIKQANKNEEDEDEFEKLDLKVWAKIFKIIIKDKRIVVQLIIAVIMLALNDLIYPLVNRYALENYFNDNPDFSTKWIYIIGYALMALHLGVTVWS